MGINIEDFCLIDVIFASWSKSYVPEQIRQFTMIKKIYILNKLYKRITINNVKFNHTEKFIRRSKKFFLSIPHQKTFNTKLVVKIFMFSFPFFKD